MMGARLKEELKVPMALQVRDGDEDDVVLAVDDRLLRMELNEDVLLLLVPVVRVVVLGI